MVKIKQKKVLLLALCWVDLIIFSSHDMLQFVPDVEPSSQTLHIPLHVLTDLFPCFSQLSIYS